MSKYKKNVGAFVLANGVSFRVWAPFAESVGVVGNFTDAEIALKNEGDGYWHQNIKEAKAGHEYQYVIKNGDQTLYRNDPRAKHLTTSSGYSVITDHSFDWTGDDFEAPPIE